jgi:hypothetical protein
MHYAIYGVLVVKKRENIRKYRQRRFYIRVVNRSYFLVFSRQTTDSKILLLVPVYLKVYKVICDETYQKRR